MATGYRLDDRRWIPGSGIIFLLVEMSDRVQNTSSLLAYAYQTSFPRKQNGRSVKLSIHLHLLLIKIAWSFISSLTIRFHDVVLRNRDTLTIIIIIVFYCFLF
jgi:hypothetical protein